MASERTPYYLIDEARLRRNGEIVDRLRERSGVTALLALKCFAVPAAFDVLRPCLDGTTSSSLFETRLGHDHFGGETHAYSVGFADHEIDEVVDLADTIIFNSISQLNRFADRAEGTALGIRVNPGLSHSHYDLADPARRFSRLGVREPDDLRAARGRVSGAMFHFNCDNADASGLIRSLDTITDRFGWFLQSLDWVSLGGGIAFTDEGYPLDDLADALRTFGDRFDLRVVLEPGEAVVTGAGQLVTSVLDVVHNEVPIAVLDASVEAHLLDDLLYDSPSPVASPGPGPHHMILAGRTCLAGDVFGDWSFERPLTVGDEVRIDDVAGYSMVKATWFNGISRPSIVLRRLDGTVETVRRFGYDDYESSLS
jgi:carboxynorspermidine decarboxylase